jgi:hypothetical protein
MTDIKRILLLVVIVLSFYLLYKLVERRRAILAEYETEKEVSSLSEKENFEVMSRISSSANLQFPLKEYEIMSSWNSATDTNLKVSLAALDNVLKRGYRFIDLEIYSVDNIPNVGFSTQSAFDSMESTPIPFLEVCKQIMLTAFITNNGADPLFINLRIKSKSPTIFGQLADIFVSECKPRLYDGKVKGSTILSELKGKIIIIIDRNYYPQSETYTCKAPSCTNDFTTMINKYSGTPALQTWSVVDKMNQPTQPLKITKNGFTNVEKLQMMIHNMGSLNVASNGPEFHALLKTYSIQILPQKVYYQDKYLTQYEEFFTNNGHRAFVPMAIACSYVQNLVD